MSLGLPDIGTGSLYYSQYDSNITDLLTRLQDNSSNIILAKDVRDPLWTLWNRITDVGSQSLTQSALFTLGTPSTATLGGILEGSTFSNATLQSVFEQLLLPYITPDIVLTPSYTELQFGQLVGVGLSYSINVGSVPLQSLNFVGPWLPITSTVPTGSDPETGLKSAGNPTFSTSVSLSQLNTWTMSVVTTDSLTFTVSTSLTYKHKIYFGSITIPGGFTASSPASVAAVGSYLTDNRIKGLSFSNLALNTNMSQIISFNSNYFVFASPTVMGSNFPFGFYIDNIFSQGFTKVRNTSTFSNEYSYQSQYDVYISNYALDGLLLVDNPSVGSFSSNTIDQLWEFTTNNNIKPTSNTAGIFAPNVNNTNITLVNTNIGGSNQVGSVYDDGSITGRMTINDDMGINIDLSMGGPTGGSGLNINTNSLQLASIIGTQSIYVILENHELSIYKDSVKVFCITDSGTISTNQVIAGTPGAAANKRIPIYDISGILQGYIDLTS